MNERAETEWQWFRRSLRDSLFRPRRFAATLAREHFGLAGVLVAILAGAALSLSVDSVIAAAKGVAPLDLAARLVIDACLLGLRVAIVAAVTAAGLAALARVRRRELSLDQAFTALAFGLTPLLVAPVLALALVTVPETLPLVGALALALAVRVLYGLFLSLRRLVATVTAVAAIALVAASVPFTLSDQVSRIAFAALAYAPTLAPAIEATPSGRPEAGDGYELTLPERWTKASLGLPGEVGRYTTETDVLVIVRVRGDPLLTPDTYADTVGVPWRFGLAVASEARRIERARDLVLVDDVHRGTVDGRPELLRQFTAVVGTQGLALLFRYIEPDEPRALAESAAIAASWRVGGR